MDCEASTDLQLDLLYEELQEPLASELRRHLEACAHCRKAWERLNRGHHLGRQLARIEAPAPSPALLAAIASAAAGFAATPDATSSSSRVGPVVPLDTASDHGSARPSWLRRVGEMAMRRQVAMAAVSVLAVGIGLRFVPFRTTPAPLPTTESTSPSVVPATELPRASASPAAAPSPSAQRRERSAPAYLGNTPVYPLRARPAPTPTAARSPDDGTEERRAQAPTESATDELTQAPNETRSAGSEGYAHPAPTASNHRARHTLGAALAEPEATEQPTAIAQLAPSALENTRPSSPAATGSSARGRAGLGTSLGAANTTAPSWQSYRADGDQRRARGDLDGAMASYRRALSSAPASERPALEATLRSLAQQNTQRSVQTEVAAQPSSPPRPVSQVPRSSPSRSAAPRPARRSTTDSNNSTTQFGL